MKPRYRLVGRVDGRYIWEATIPGDSRVEQLRCGVVWFWRHDRAIARRLEAEHLARRPRPHPARRCGSIQCARCYDLTGRPS